MKYAVTESVKKPQGRRGEDAGIDLFVPDNWNNGQPYKLYVGEQVNIPSGIKFDIPEGYELQIENKSGVSTKKGVTRGATICDHSYRGVVHINLHKGVIGKEDFIDINGECIPQAEVTGDDRRSKLNYFYTTITPGEKIAQAILFKISDEPITEIPLAEYDTVETVRGAGAFGSTGTK